jgi:predicted acyltransferase (DUF342 family)
VSGATDLNDLLRVSGETTIGSNAYIMGPGLLIPTGTTSERPTPQQVGLIRYNTETSQFEGYGAGNAWGSLGGVIDVDQDTFVSAEETASGDDDNLRFVTFGNERMRITDTGLIGMGTTSPQVELDVVGDFRLSGDTTIGSQFRVIGDTSLDSTLQVAGETDINDVLRVSGDTTIGSQLRVIGSSVLEGDTLVDDTLQVSGVTTIGSELRVAGNTTITGDLTVLGAQASERVAVPAVMLMSP